ncbi:MAG: SPOR domain-containing protein [Gammaproteobacteria bacterium]|nr:MAG: SPOR domain-containing protein [Gammaproteobacteria bacterium]
MRLLFLFMLMVNAGIYMWYSTHGNQVGASPVRPIPTGVPVLELLGEKTQQELADTMTSTRALSGDVSDDEVHEAVEEKIMHCYTLGPFMNQDTTEQAAEELTTSGRPIVKRTSEKKEQIGYWVYLPSYKSQSAASAVAQEFKLLGDKHYYIVQPPDENAYAVSLGLFKARKNAEKRFSQVKNLGYDAKLEPRFRQNPVFWLDYAEQADSLPFDTSLMVGVQKLPRNCEQIASGDALP